MKADWKTVIKLFVIFLLFLFGIQFAFVGCGVFISENSALEAVNKAGFSDPVVLNSHVFFLSFHGCSPESGDRVAFIVEATNSKKERVKLTVCAGYWKGTTIRY